MSYKALLFCSEASSARVITQVLSEMDFECEPCDEPFAAVKKLTSERLDATVIDCSDEQDAALLVKSARNSSFNQQALFVAVVDGKNGVASAFRLGANLVLTKPVSVEQAKSTLRMARGLLHKSEVAKAAAAAAQSSSASEPAAVMPTPAMPEPPAVPSPLWEPTAAVSAPPASILEVETEPAPSLEPAEAGLLESIPDPDNSGKPAPSAWPAVAARKEALPENSSEPVRPMASSFEAEETVSESETEAMAADSPALPASPVAEVLAARPLAERSVGVGADAGQGSADTPAPTRPEAPGSAKAAKVISDQKFAPPAAKSVKPEVESSKGKWFAIALLVLALLAAAYLAWKQLRPSSGGATVPHLSSTPAPSPPAAQPAASEPVPAQTADTTPSQPSPNQAKQIPAAFTTTPRQTAPVLKYTVDSAASAPPVLAPAQRDVAVVSRQPATPIPSPKLSDDQPAPVASAVMEVASSSQNQAAPSILTTPSANVPAFTPENTRISQGVAQGLLIKRVQPVYPPSALSMRLQGAVELLATIGKDGSVTNLKQISGDPSLGRAAMDAVRQWKYRPYLLNGEPLDIQTQIIVNFKAQ